ncbi:MAG TPA: YggT family protein [Acidimicrobiales bacterium]|nr:YggT family protein [Acidimicrobiales bacterium]
MGLVCLLLQLYVVAVLGRILLSYFPISPGSAMASVFSALYTVTEPVLGPVRRVMPPVGIGGMGLDLSPMVVLLGIQLLVVPALC